MARQIAATRTGLMQRLSQDVGPDAQPAASAANQFLELPAREPAASNDRFAQRRTIVHGLGKPRYGFDLFAREQSLRRNRFNQRRHAVAPSQACAVSSAPGGSNPRPTPAS